MQMELVVAVLIALGTQDVVPADESWRLAPQPVLSLGSVGGEADDAFGSVMGAIRFDSGEIMVADGMSKELLLFSDGGTLLTRSGGRGEGPGEFRVIRSIHRCADDFALVYDPAAFRMSVFEPTGQFSGTIDIPGEPGRDAPPYDFFCNSEGVIAYLHRSSAPPVSVGPRRPTVDITAVGPDGRVVQLGSFPGPERYFDGSMDFPRPLGSLTSIAVGFDRLYVGTGDYVEGSDTFKITIFSLDGEDIGAITDKASRGRVTKEHVSRFIDEHVASRAGRADEERLRRFFAELEYPPTLPPYAGLLVDPAGNLWIEEHPLAESSRRIWRIYLPDGTPLCTLEVPSGFQITEAGNEYVLGVSQGSLGISSVQMYKLMKSPVSEGH